MPAAVAPAKRGEETRHLLLVVDDPCTPPALSAEVRGHAGTDDLDILVIAPAHDSPSTQWYVDEDAARADATQRLRVCAACLRGERASVRTRLGDADPVQAMKDALFEYDADEILVVTVDQRPPHWLRPSVIERARAIGLPLTHIVMTAGGDRY